MDDYITELENEHAEIKNTISTLCDRGFAIRQKLVEHFHKIKPGMVVIVKGTKYKIDHIQIPQNWSPYERTARPWVYAFIMKKDGTWGKRAQCIYSDWELPKE